jgi:hypothetical protein
MARIVPHLSADQNAVSPVAQQSFYLLSHNRQTH